MRTLLTTLTLAISIAHASAPPIEPDPCENAAVLYGRAFLAITFAGMEDDLAAFAYDDPTAEVPEWLAAAVGGEQHAVDTLSRATSLERCDWMLDHTRGLDLRLTHLGHVRTAARVLAIDARLHAADGKPAKATDRLLAIIAMSRHTRTDRTGISSLVSAALIGLAEDTFNAAAPMLDEASVRRVALGVQDRLDDSDVIGARAAIRGEQSLALDWIRSAMVEGATGTDIADRIQREFYGNSDRFSVVLGKRLDRLRAMDADSLRRAVEHADRYYEAILRDWDSDDALDRLRDLNNEASEGSVGTLVALLGLATSKLRIAETEVLELLARMQALLSDADAGTQK